MKPRLPLTLLALASLAISLATAVLWVRSYRGFDVLFHYQAPGQAGLGGDDFQIVSCRPGRLEYRTTAIVAGGGPWPKWYQPSASMPGTPAHRSTEFLGFGIEYKVDVNLFMTTGVSPLMILRRTVWIPHWSIALPAAILPALWAIRFTRYRRLRRTPTLCPQCGYNLTGNTSGVCPECGAGKYESERVRNQV